MFYYRGLMIVRVPVRLNCGDLSPEAVGIELLNMSWLSQWHVLHIKKVSAGLAANYASTREKLSKTNIHNPGRNYIGLHQKLINFN